MFDYIEDLKTKPVHIRKRFAFLTAFSFSALILAGWIGSYTLKSSPILAEGKSQIEAPVSALTASAGSLWGDIKNFFKSSNETEYSSDAFEIEGGTR
ncbi:MAG: hypothetical protein V4697_03000 [Patescibacteria group bacterium]